MCIDDCKTINHVKKVLKEQNITIPDWKLGACNTIKEIIEICKSYGAK